MDKISLLFTAIRISNNDTFKFVLLFLGILITIAWAMNTSVISVNHKSLFCVLDMKHLLNNNFIASLIYSW